MTAVYGTSDPRSQLERADTVVTRAEGGDVLPFQHFELRSTEHTTTASGSRTWTVRAQNIVAVWTELVANDLLERDEIDETMLLVLRSTGHVTVEAAGESVELEATSIVVVPPGTSRVVASDGATILRLFATSASDLVEDAQNAGLYAPAPSSIAVHEPWPSPIVGEKLHVYADLDAIEASPDRMGRIFRNRHVMVNLLYPRNGPRDPRTLSPHDHDDFEQMSIVYEGSYVHHIRAHWGKDRLQWRDDEHVSSASPSIAIIPPPLIHTSEAVGAGTNRMIDIFAGPRADFSARPGWVLNAEDYPAPESDAR